MSAEAGRIIGFFAALFFAIWMLVRRSGATGSDGGSDSSSDWNSDSDSGDGGGDGGGGGD